MQKEEAKWPEESKKLASELHSQLRLGHENWHHLKSNPDRRAAELVAGGLVQLLSEGKPSDIQAMLEQGIRWLNREIKDPGCPHR